MIKSFKYKGLEDFFYDGTKKGIRPEHADKIAKILNQKGAVTPDMALRLSRAFNTTPELWLNLQKNFDLWQAEHSSNDWKRVHPLSDKRLHSNV